MTTSRPRRARDVSTRELPDGNVAVLVLSRDLALVLNATAAAVLDLCNGERSLDDIAAIVCEACDAARDVVLADVAGIVAQLRETGCLEAEH